MCVGGVGGGWLSLLRRAGWSGRKEGIFEHLRNE